ncbi:SYF2 splicing factor [Malassezia caprae]|uniref:Pre-mRNA-splicing factor SYF2 n=1 Tax=Malassezia caprae TaxID=1381934 RepID=A0AAF0E8N1_9BASI|nr:SYF2 splicing factor [Malassezia caprae]
MPTAASRAERRARMQALQAQLRDSSRANRSDVLEEQARQREAAQKRSTAHAHKLAKAERLLDERDMRERGEDVERHRAMHYTIEENEAWEKKLEEKERTRDKGMIDFQDLAERSYQRQIRQLKPDHAAYAQQKHAEAPTGERQLLRTGEAVSPAVASYGTHAPDEDAVDRLVSHLNHEHDQIQRRSRRREDDLDVEGTYINQRNKRFNRKIQRYFGEHTKELRENLERGTAMHHRPAARALRAPLLRADEWVVFDLGSRVCRAGFGGEAAPHALFDACALVHRADASDALWDLDWQRVDARSARERHAELVRRLARIVRSVYQEHLLCEGKAHPVLVAHSPLGLEPLRRAWCDVLLRAMHAPSVSFVDTHVLCTLAAGRTSALVVDLGHLETCVMPVYDGRPMTPLVATTPRAGRRLAQGLEALLRAHAPRRDGAAEYSEAIVGIQTQLLFVGAPPDAPAAGAAWPVDPDAFARAYAARPTSTSEAHYRGIQVPGWLRERAAELLLEPGDEDEQSVSECIAQCVRALPRDLRREMQASVLLAGGTAMLPGLARRLEADVARALGEAPGAVRVLGGRTSFVPGQPRRAL